MKFLLIPILMISFSLQAQDYSGYIVKLKRNTSGVLNSFAGIGKLERMRVRGQYLYKLASNNKLTKLDIKSFESHPDVEYIEPNYYYHLVKPVETTWGREISEKQGFKKQWNLLNRGKRQQGRGMKYIEGKDISALKAWEKTKGNKDIIIAVIDTGVEYNHPDIKENIWVNQAEKNGEPGVDDDLNGYVDDIHGWDFAKKISDPIDNEWGHGTHVAGIIAATHNERGIKGVMNKAKIMALKIFNKKAEGEARSPTSGIIESFYYAIENDVKIINASWGGGAYSKALEDAIKDLAKNNIIFVTTAGNHKRNNDEKPYYPAGYDSDNIVVVGAFNGTGTKSWYSGYGKESVDIWAPGNDILSLSKRNTIGEFKYSEKSGTSMAAPHVAATLGLGHSVSPSLDYRTAIQTLMNTTVPEAQLNDLSRYGRLDASGFLEGLTDL